MAPLPDRAHATALLARAREFIERTKGPKQFSKAGAPTSQSVAEAIERLRDSLFREYGIEYAFAVMGRREIIGASNNENGVLHAWHAVARRDGDA